MCLRRLAPKGPKLEKHNSRFPFFSPERLGEPSRHVLISIVPIEKSQVWRLGQLKGAPTVGPPLVQAVVPETSPLGPDFKRHQADAVVLLLGAPTDWSVASRTSDNIKNIWLLVRA